MDNRLSKETGTIKMITSEVSHLVITSKINETASWCYRFMKMHGLSKHTWTRDKQNMMAKNKVLHFLGVFNAMQKFYQTLTHK